MIAIVYHLIDQVLSWLCLCVTVVTDVMSMLIADFRIRSPVEKLGREMVEKCAGLPLAIIMLGGLLATKANILEWDAIHRNIISHLMRGKGREQCVSEILALSYHELPYQLKPCFLHLAHFPEDYEIPTKKLTRMWVAEGFISCAYNEEMVEETMKDVSQHYLDGLVERCMVQVVKEAQLEESEIVECMIL